MLIRNYKRELSGLAPFYVIYWHMREVATPLLMFSVGVGEVRFTELGPKILRRITAWSCQ